MLHCHFEEGLSNADAFYFQIKDIFDGLKYLHTRKQPIRHRDLKSVSD